MGTLLRNEQCPRCAKVGHDRSGDNLAVYTDGSFCFRCGYTKNASQWHLKALESSKKDEGTSTPFPTLPSDCSPDLPVQAVEWLRECNIALTAQVKEGILWSDWWQRVIFPVRAEGELLGWQGRYIKLSSEDKDKPKWFTKGNIKKYPLIYDKGQGKLYPQKDKGIVLVEDILSFIRLKATISRHLLCLFGSDVSDDLLSQLKLRDYDRIIFWLDADKYEYSLRRSNDCKAYGFITNCIKTSLDPKNVFQRELKEINESILESTA